MYENFSPKNWGKAQRKKDELAKRQCITLNQLDDIYGVDGAAKLVVKANLGGVYSLGMNREVMNQNTADMASDLFVARFGKDCTMFALMIYFSGYLMDYKGTYSNYDVQDILLQFSKKFLPWFRQKQGVKEMKSGEVMNDGPKGLDGLMVYLMAKKRNGEDLRSGGLYRLGYVTEDIIQDVERKVESGVF